MRGAAHELTVNSRSMLRIMGAFASYLDMPEVHLTEHRALPAFERSTRAGRRGWGRIHGGKGPLQVGAAWNGI